MCDRSWSVGEQARAALSDGMQLTDTSINAAPSQFPFKAFSERLGDRSCLGFPGQVRELLSKSTRFVVLDIEAHDVERRVEAHTPHLPFFDA